MIDGRAECQCRQRPDARHGCFPSRLWPHRDHVLPLVRSSHSPCSGRGDGLLEVFGKAPVSVDTSQSALADSPAREDCEAVGLVGTLEGIDRD